VLVKNNLKFLEAPNFHHKVPFVELQFWQELLKTYLEVKLM